MDASHFQYSKPQNVDLNFDGIFKAKVKWPSVNPIPKVAHFVYTDVRELAWLEWAAVRGAVANLGVDKVNIWLPEQADLKGWIWNRILEMPEVQMRKIAMPKTVYGVSIDTPEQQSDIVRLKILYEEGGIFLDSDLVPLKSSDDVIYCNSTRSTVMALQQRGNGMPNGMIMSKPRSPFLKRWIQQYRGIKQKDDWDRLSTTLPHTMYTDMDPDLTALDGHSWFYPLSSQKNGDTSLKMLWFGKSWYDIDKSYGTHFWHPTADFAKMITPKTIQTIDTPLFCKLRKLFDNLDDDGIFSVPEDKNINCSITRVSDLNAKNHRMFSDYKMSTDDLDNKWIDSSGFNNHGWAPRGTLLKSNHASGPVFRNITAGSYAVLPVPADWDCRVWSVRMMFEVDTKHIAEGDGVGLFKIRMEDGGEVLVRVRNDNPYPGITLKLEWSGNKLAAQQYQKLDNLIWVSQAGLPGLKTGPHELSITHDRRDHGAVNLFLDGERIANTTIPIIASPKIGQEIWFNAQNWNKMDTGFRGALERFTMYADALPPHDVALPISTVPNKSFTYTHLTDLKNNINIPQAARSPWALFFPLVMVLMVLLFIGRRKKAWLMSIPEYFGSIPEYVKKVPNRATELASRLPLLSQGVNESKERSVQRRRNLGRIFQWHQSGTGSSLDQCTGREGGIQARQERLVI